MSDASKRAAAKPDLVYLVHEDSEPLRYSLRSVARYAAGQYRRVWVAGMLPQWLTGVGHIAVDEPEPREKFASIRSKLEAAVAHRGVAKRVVVMNDDYIATAPVESWEPTHLGPTSTYVAQCSRPRNTWWEAMQHTAAWMDERGHGDTLCYAGHVPLMYDRVKLRDLLAEYPANRRLLDCGLYPEAGVGGVGVLGPNAKVGPSAGEFAEKVPDPDAPPPWLSLNDESWASGLIGGYVRGMFRERCEFERDV